MATGGVQEQYFFFWKIHSPFSQWHPSEFTVDGVKYSCAEQYMMHRKAELFGDNETAGEILNTTDPRKMKALGRKVQNFDQTLWNDSCQEVVKRASFEKFSQNPHLKMELFKTEGKTLVEASPVDRIWGIGLAENNPKSRFKREWRGKNLLGYILTGVREELALLEAKSQSLKYTKEEETVARQPDSVTEKREETTEDKNTVTDTEVPEEVDVKPVAEDSEPAVIKKPASSIAEEDKTVARQPDSATEKLEGTTENENTVTDAEVPPEEVDVEENLKQIKSEKSSEEMDKADDTVEAPQL